MIFGRLLGSPWDLSLIGQKSQRQSLHPVNCLQEESPCYLYLECLLPLRYGALYMQPGWLVPRARGRIYVAFGEHPAAGAWGLEFVGWVVSVLCVVCCVCVCLCVVVYLFVFVCVCVRVFVLLGVLLFVCV